MNKLILTLGFVVLGNVAAVQAADDVSFVDFAQLARTTATVGTMDLINWKVGDEQDYNITMAALPIPGTMVKSVTKDEGTAIWVTEDMNMMIQKSNVQVLINKADGKVLKMIQDGQEKPVPDDKVTIISQDYTSVTVPAGTFKCVHVVAKTADVDNLEIWANPKDTVMEGALKELIKTQGQDVTLELTSFKHGS